jgi:hypothetical protein
MSAFLKYRAPHHTNRIAAEPPRSAAARLEERVATLRLKVVQEKRRLHEASAREQSIREGVVGRAVWTLIQKDLLKRDVIDLIREELRGSLGPTQSAALSNTTFG